MYQQFYESSAFLYLPLFTLIFFVAFFIAMVVWVFGFGGKDGRFDRMAELPLAAERTSGGKNDE